MNTTVKEHTHRPQRRRGPYAWNHCIARGGACDGAAHGGVMWVDVCRCGAERKTESNGTHRQLGAWT